MKAAVWHGGVGVWLERETRLPVPNLTWTSNLAIVRFLTYLRESWE